MDYKEKYIAALERAKEMCAMPTDKATMEYIFPELKESEGERIRKKVIEVLKLNIKGAESQMQASRGVDRCFEIYACNKVIAWLEKQGEQPTDKVEPKFHEGDIVQYITDSTDRRKIEEIDTLCNMYHTDSSPIMFDVENEWKVVVNAEDVEEESVDKVEPKFYEEEWLCENEPNNYARFIQILEIVNVQGKERYRISRDIHNDEDIVEFGFVEKYYHKFDIQDAKDGDVLASKDGHDILIFRNLDSNEDFSSYYNIMGREELGWFNIRFIPATKEQRDLLFTKMKDDGYDWDAKNNTLWQTK